MVNVNDIAITSLDMITVYKPTTGAFWFALDEPTDCSIANSEETQDITGKNGRILGRLKRNKSVTISASNGLVSAGLLEAQTGGEFESKTTEVLWTDYLTVISNSASTNYVATGTSGAEIDELYIRNTDGTLGEELTQGSAAASGTFAYDPDTKALTFSGVDDGAEIVVYYKRTITADVLENDSDIYSAKGIVYIDATGEDKCNNEYHIQIYIPKADFSGEFSLEFGDSQTVHDFEATALAGACGNSSTLWTYTLFGVDTTDAA